MRLHGCRIYEIYMRSLFVYTQIVNFYWLQALLSGFHKNKLPLTLWLDGSIAKVIWRNNGRVGVLTNVPSFRMLWKR